MGQEVVLCSGKKMGVFTTGRCDRERGGEKCWPLRAGTYGGHPPSSVKAGSQDSTKGIINNMHESQWPQVKHFSFFQALRSEAAPFRSGLPVTQRASVGSSSASFPVWRHFRRLFPPSESDWALRTPEGLQPGWRADTHSPCKPGIARDHCRTQHPGCMRLELKTSLWNLHRWCFTRHTGVIPWWLHQLTQKTQEVCDWHCSFAKWKKGIQSALAVVQIKWHLSWAWHSASMGASRVMVTVGHPQSSKPGAVTEAFPFPWEAWRTFEPPPPTQSQGLGENTLCEQESP